jgi:hypothetical protein
VNLHGQEEKESQEERQEEEVDLWSDAWLYDSVRPAPVLRTNFPFRASAPKEASERWESFHATAEAFFFCAAIAKSSPHHIAAVSRDAFQRDTLSAAGFAG